MILSIFISACSLKPDLVEEPKSYSLAIFDNEYYKDKIRAGIKTPYDKMLKINNKKSIQILNIESPFYLKTNKIYYSNGVIFDSYNKHIFSDSPVNFFKNKLKNSLENSNTFNAVFDFTVNANADYFLVADFQKFQKVFYENSKSYVESKLTVFLIESKSKKVISHQSFIIIEVLANEDINELITTFNNVLESLVDRSTVWINKEIKKKE